MAKAGNSALKLMDEQAQQNIRFFEAMLSNFSSSRPGSKSSGTIESGTTKRVKGE
jgi:hypothetical protein